MKKRKKMIQVYAKYTCGCCVATMKFYSKEDAEQAFAEARLGNCVIMYDCKQNVHTIDTYYSFAYTKEEITARNNRYLLEQI